MFLSTPTPYRLMEVSDHFGKFAKIPNPQVEQELKLVTIGKAYWPEADDVPTDIKELKWSKGPGIGRFLIHCEEWQENAGDHLQYRAFMRRADLGFVLRAKDKPDVLCQISKSFYTLHSKNLCELEVVILPAEYSKMDAGVAYSLHPTNGKKGYEWKVREGVVFEEIDMIQNLVNSSRKRSPGAACCSYQSAALSNTCLAARRKMMEGLIFETEQVPLL